MKASEMICLLAKQIEMNGDREVKLWIDGSRSELAGYPRSVTWDTDNKVIEIYGE
jgi:hypothetical protein